MRRFVFSHNVAENIVRKIFPSDRFGLGMSDTRRLVRLSQHILEGGKMKDEERGQDFLQASAVIEDAMQRR